VARGVFSDVGLQVLQVQQVGREDRLTTFKRFEDMRV
jgi:hypothetical protein